MMKRKFSVLAIMLLLMFPLPAHALQFGFEAITSNSIGDPGIGEAQLFVDVTDAGSNQASFRFFNTGPLASSITDVYFDDGSLLGIAYLIDADEGGGDAGVDFSQLASPGNLPSANNATPPFVTTAGFSADSDPSVQPNGVNPGEELYVIFDLVVGAVFDNVLADLASGDLRIGIHVQGFADGKSESFVNDGNGDVPVPEPATMLLLGTGLVGLAGFRKKFKK
jgi:hypothetical protein